MITLSRGLANGVRRISTGPLAPTYVNDLPSVSPSFAVANQTLLRNISPFVAISRTGATSSEKDDIVVLQPANHTNTNIATGQTDFSTLGAYLIGADTGSARHYCEIILDGINGNFRFQLGAIDNGRRVEVNTEGKAVRYWSGTSGAEVEGAATSTVTQYQSLTARSLNGRDVVAGEVLRATVFDGVVVVTRNGIYQDTFTGVPQLGGTYLGQSTGSVRGYRQIGVQKGNAVKTLFTVTAGKGWYNRIVGWAGFTNGGRRVTRTGTWKGEKPTGLLWRLLNPNNGAVLQNWTGAPYAQTTITTTSGTGVNQVGTWSVSVDIECGLNGTEDYTFAIGSAEQTNFNNMSEVGRFAICVGFLAYGQSEIAGANSTVVAPGYPDAPGTAWYQMKDPATLDFTEQPYNIATNWRRDQVDSGANGTGDRQSAWFCSLLAKAYNMPVSLSVVALGARLSQALGPGDTGNDWTEIQRHLAFIGCFEHVIAGEGSAEANAGGAASWTPNTAANIQAYLAYSNQPVSHVPYWFMLPTGFGNTPGEVGTLAQQANANSIRSQQAAFPAYMLAQPTPRNVVISASAVDLTYDGAGEFNDAIRSGGEMLRRIALTIAQTFGKTGSGLGAFDGRGPFRSGQPTRSGAVITIPYNLNGATSMSGTGLLGHIVSLNADMSSPLTISSAAVSGSSVVVTLSAAPGAPVYWTDYYNFGPLNTGRAIGAYAAISDGAPSSGALTIPVLPSPVPVLST